MSIDQQTPPEPLWLLFRPYFWPLGHHLCFNVTFGPLALLLPIKLRTSPITKFSCYSHDHRNIYLWQWSGTLGSPLMALRKTPLLKPQSLDPHFAKNISTLPVTQSLGVIEQASYVYKRKGFLNLLGDMVAILPKPSEWKKKRVMGNWKHSCLQSSQGTHPFT